MKRIQAYLLLTDAQVEELKRIRTRVVGDDRSLRTTRKELNDLVDAFEGEEFGIALDAFQARKLAIVRGRVTHVAGHADGALSVLSAEQRELLADLIEVGPEGL